MKLFIYLSLSNISVFSLFSIVSFKNKGCRATTGYNGTCYTSTECASKSGTASGNCAAGWELAWAQFLKKY